MKSHKTQILPIVLTSILGTVILGGSLHYAYNGGLFSGVFKEQSNEGKSYKQDSLNNQKTSNSNNQFVQTIPRKPSLYSLEATKASEEALKALRKIAAATDVGTTFQTYNSLVIDAKAQVDEAQRKLPQGELRKAFESAIDAYSDVVTIWNEKIVKRMDNLYAREPSHLYLIKKYKLQTKSVDYSGVASDVGVVKQVDIDVAMQMIWIEGRRQVERISSLLENNQ